MDRVDGGPSLDRSSGGGYEEPAGETAGASSSAGPGPSIPGGQARGAPTQEEPGGDVATRGDELEAFHLEQAVEASEAEAAQRAEEAWRRRRLARELATEFLRERRRQATDFDAAGELQHRRGFPDFGPLATRPRGLC